MCLGPTSALKCCMGAVEREHGQLRDRLTLSGVTQVGFRRPARRGVVSGRPGAGRPPTPDRRVTTGAKRVPETPGAKVPETSSRAK